MSEIWPYFLPYLIFQGPIMLVFIAGMLIAVSRFGAQPRVSVTALAAFALLSLARLISFAFSIWMAAAAREASIQVLQQMSALSSLGQVVTLILNLAGWVLILVAIFAWRQQGRAVGPAPVGAA